MSAETDFVTLFENDDSRNILLGAMHAVWYEIQWRELPGAEASPYLLHRRVDHSLDGLVMVKKNTPLDADRTKEKLGLETYLFSEAVRTIASKTPIEKKRIALQLLGYQVDRSKEAVTVDHAAKVVSMLLEGLGLHFAEIDILREQIQGIKDGIRNYAQIEDRIETRLSGLKKKKIWYGNIGEACGEILKRVRENEKLLAKERTYPVEGESACKAFLDEYEFFDDPDYTVEKLHNYYRRVKG